jgi:hypothetical protein
VFPRVTNTNWLLRLLTTMVVSVFLLQSALAGGDMAARHGEGTSGEICVVSQPSSDTNGAPASPAGAASHHSFCCILHISAINIPPNESHASLIRLQFPHDTVASWLSDDAATPRREPSRTPQSPRAPPFSA